MINAFRLSLFAFFFSIFFSQAQKMEIISASNNSDSSLYDICKLNSNEFWICGEHGILKTIDSSGNIGTISYNNEGKSFYKMVKFADYIYIAADKGTIYKFNTLKHKVDKIYSFQKYKEHSFYDLILLNNGKLVACGGKSKIVKTHLAIPSGFILEIDTAFSGKTKALWKNKFNFVWSLTQDSSNIYASTFNGKSSKILIKHNNKGNFKKEYKIKALIHKIIAYQDTIWLLGSKNIHFYNDGIIGNIYNDSVHLTTISGKGCIWSLIFDNNSKFAFANNGSILFNQSLNWICSDLNSHRAIYAATRLNNRSIVMIGNGKTIIFLKK